MQPGGKRLYRRVQVLCDLDIVAAEGWLGSIEVRMLAGIGAKPLHLLIISLPIAEIFVGRIALVVYFV